MYKYKGKFCLIEELTTLNDDRLYTLMYENRDEYEKLIFREPIPCTYLEFRKKIDEWFSHGRNYQFLVYDKSGQRVVGTMFFYNINKVPNTVKCSCFFTPEVRNKILTIESLVTMLDFTRNVLKVNGINFLVYRENMLMHKIANKSGATRLVTGQENINTSSLDISYEFSSKTLDLLLEKYGSRFTKLH
ncbi:MAG: GNAT family protein [bacterium]